MRKILIPALFVTASLLAAADTKEVQRTLPLTANGTVSLETHKGSVRISAWDRSDVEVHAIIAAEPGTTMNRRSFDGTEVVIEATADSVRIRTKYPELLNCCSDNDISPEVRYEIHIPRSAHLRVRDHRSNSEISGVGGGLDLDTHRGSVRVDALRGALKLTTHRGDVRVTFASFQGDSSVETYRGNIELALPRESRFALKAETERHASFQSDFPMMVKSGVMKNGSRVEADVNGGGPSLRVQSHRGQIHLKAL